MPCQIYEVNTVILIFNDYIIKKKGLTTSVVLGAGFSFVAGLPLTNELFEVSDIPRATSIKARRQHEDVINAYRTWKKDNPSKQYLDCVGLKCPMPIVELFRKFEKLKKGELLEIEADDPAFASDVRAWCNKMGHEIVNKKEKSNSVSVIIKKKN